MRQAGAHRGWIDGVHVLILYIFVSEPIICKISMVVVRQPTR